MGDGQRLMRRLYDALRAEYQKDLPPDAPHLFEVGYRTGLDKAISILVEVNQGAPAAESAK